MRRFARKIAILSAGGISCSFCRVGLPTEYLGHFCCFECICAPTASFNAFALERCESTSNHPTAYISYDTTQRLTRQNSGYFARVTQKSFPPFPPGTSFAFPVGSIFPPSKYVDRCLSAVDYLSLFLSGQSRSNIFRLSCPFSCPTENLVHFFVIRCISTCKLGNHTTPQISYETTQRLTRQNSRNYAKDIKKSSPPFPPGNNVVFVEKNRKKISISTLIPGGRGGSKI